MKKYIGALFLLWTGALLVAYYAVQKPGLLNILTGLLDTAWTLLVAAILLFNAFGLGRRTLGLFRIGRQDPLDKLFLGWGTGLGMLGLLGLLFAALQLANRNLLTAFQIALALTFLFVGDLKKLREDLNTLRSSLHVSFSQYGWFTKLALVLPLLFAFLLTFTPPFEAFDALFYHLTQPARRVPASG